MLVVMDQGYATRAGEPPVPAGQRGGGAGQPDAFQDVVLRDLVPTIDASYRTLKDRRNRAIAGLSMGAGQAVRIGFGNPDVFASVGAFTCRTSFFRLEVDSVGADATVALALADGNHALPLLHVLAVASAILCAAIRID